MSDKTNHDLVAETFASQLHNDALALAKRIEGEIGTLNAREMGKQGMLEIAARNWNDPRPIWGPQQNQTFRAYLLLTMGPANLVKLYEEGAKRRMLHPDQPAPQPMLGTMVAPMTSGPPASLAVNPTPPNLPKAVVGAMTNANG